MSAAGRDAQGRELLALALSDPAAALARADRLIATQTDPIQASYAWQARGIVLRDRGETAAAIRGLRRGLGLAQAGADVDRAADVRATLGAALVMHGATRAGLDELGAAVEAGRGVTRATVLMRRAHVLAFVGHHEAALADLRRAVPGIRRSGDRVWEARALNNRGDVLMRLGDVTGADRDVARAEQLFAETGQRLEAIHAVHNRGVLAYLRGDLPASFELFERAAQGYQALGVMSADLVVDRCEAYLTAALASDAVDLAAGTLAGRSVQPRHRADIELTLATAALALGDVASAESAARRARRRFDRQDRMLWVLKSDLVLVRAKFSAGARSRAFLTTARQLGHRLTQAGADGAEVAWLVAGRVAADRGWDSCHDDFARAGARRRSASPQVRATAWLARALDRETTDVGAGVLRACGRGLDALDEQIALVGGTQLRALVTSHGDELATTALRHVVRSGDARAMLRWAERWRAVALARRPVRPPHEAALAAQLAAIRATARAIDEARDAGAATRPLIEQRARLERELAEASLRVSAAPGHSSRVDFDALIGGLGDRALVELVAVDGTLHGVVVRSRRFRRHVIGPVATAARAIERARFALRQAARGRPTDLAGAARQLEAAVLGDTVRRLGDEAVVISPPSMLSSAPWGLFPSLASRPVSACPSATAWVRARGIEPDGHTGSVLVAGPGVAGGDEEVATLASQNPAAVVLRGPAATVDLTLKALDGAAVAHIAAHGRHRRDNPMFSGLDLHDGLLTVHDLEALRRPPYRVVLSACDSGVMASVGSDEVLGMAAALLAMGGSGVVCSVGQVSDAATAPVMRALHTALSGGAAPDEALLAARDAAAGDPLAVATAASFTALGA